MHRRKLSWIPWFAASPIVRYYSRQSRSKLVQLSQPFWFRFFPKIVRNSWEQFRLIPGTWPDVDRLACVRKDWSADGKQINIILHQTVYSDLVFFLTRHFKIFLPSSHSNVPLMWSSIVSVILCQFYFVFGSFCWLYTVLYTVHKIFKSLENFQLSSGNLYQVWQQYLNWSFYLFVLLVLQPFNTCLTPNARLYNR